MEDMVQIAMRNMKRYFNTSFICITLAADKVYIAPGMLGTYTECKRNRTLRKTCFEHKRVWNVLVIFVELRYS